MGLNTFYLPNYRISDICVDDNLITMKLYVLLGKARGSSCTVGIEGESVFLDDIDIYGESTIKVLTQYATQFVSQYVAGGLVFFGPEDEQPVLQEVEYEAEVKAKVKRLKKRLPKKALADFAERAEMEDGQAEE